jgi:transcriptional regulator with XRE-family HTH domain
VTGVPISKLMKLSAQLKQLIKARGTTMTNVSRATSIPVQTLHSWVSGATPRDISAVKKVADYFDVSVDYLAFGMEPKAKRSHAITELEDEINAGIFEVVLRKVKNGSNR